MNLKNSIVFTNIKGKNILHSSTNNLSNTLNEFDNAAQQNLILNDNLKNSININ